MRWVLAVLALGLGGVAQAHDDPTSVHAGTASVRVGIYSAEKLEETSTTGSFSRQRTASNAYLSFSFSRKLWRGFAVDGSIGALSRGDAIIRDSSGTYVQRATVALYPISAGIRYYPIGITDHRVSPYASAVGSLVLGTQVFRSSGSTGVGSFNYRSSTDAALGWNLGAGADVHLGGRILLGFFGGYQHAKFSEPLSGLPGGVTDFSGPQFMITLGYLLTGAKDRPRGDGKNGDQGRD